jgi:O-antigen/teichoic acid export membrane protein
MHRRLTLNSVSNLGRYFVSLAVTFFLTPFIVRTLGDSVYGFWALLLSFVGYASILEMGVQPAVVKLVGQYRAVGQREKLEELITAACLFFVTGGLLAAVAFLLVLPEYVARFVPDLQGARHGELIFSAIALDVLLMFLNYVFAGILYGSQKYHAKNLIDIAGWLANAALLLAFLARHGLLALAVSKAATDAVALVATIIACRQAFPGFRRRPVARRSFRELMSFGGRIFVSATAGRLASNAQPIIITTWLSAAATAFYAIPFRLVDYARQISWALTSGFMPMFSELHSRRERAMLRAIYLNYSRYLLIVTLPAFIVILVYGEAFIGLWIGPDYAERGRLALYFLAASGLLECLQPLLWRMFIGVGRLNLLVVVSAAGSGLVVISSILLVKPLGIAGVALSVLVGSAFSQLSFAAHSCSYLGMNLTSLFWQLHARPLAAGLAAGGAARLLASELGTGSYGVIGLGATCALLAYAVLAGLVAVTPAERLWVLQKLARRARAREAARGPGLEA